MGHAIAAVRMAAAMAGVRRARCCRSGRSADIAALTGSSIATRTIVEAEREEAGCLMPISRQSIVVSTESRVVSRVVSRVTSVERVAASVESWRALLAAVRAGLWTGQASQLE